MVIRLTRNTQTTSSHLASPNNPPRRSSTTAGTFGMETLCRSQPPPKNSSGSNAIKTQDRESTSQAIANFPPRNPYARDDRSPRNIWISMRQARRQPTIHKLSSNLIHTARNSVAAQYRIAASHVKSYRRWHASCGLVAETPPPAVKSCLSCDPSGIDSRIICYYSTEHPGRVNGSHP